MIRDGGRRGNAKWGTGGYTEANPEGRAMPASFIRYQWDSLPESVRDFLSEVSGGAVIERGGTVFAGVVRAVSTDVDEWTSDKNRRRCELIDADIDGVITPEGRMELEVLTEEMRRHVDRVAPLPLEGTRRLLRELRALAAAKRAES